MTELPHVSTVNGVVTHVYQREVAASGNDSLSKIAARIRHGSSVLDVGTGSGALGRYLQEACNCVVDGVTYNDEEASLARPHYRSVVVLDLEHEGLESKLGGQQYDVVVCADVLEHLRNAEAVLKSMARLLKPGGVVIVSLPNVTHLGVVLGLMAGRFVRTREGLLDATHVHFLDRVGLQSLVDAAGFSVAAEDSVVRNLVETEFASLSIQALPKVVGDYVSALPDASVFQFVWTLRPKVAGGIASSQQLVYAGAAEIPVISQVPYFRAQLFLDMGHGFSQEHCIDAFGEQADRLQTLQFPLRESGAVRAIRIDLADRSGQVEFVYLRALDADGKVVWQWEGDWAANLVYHQTDWTGVRGWLGGRIVRLTGDDPWVQLPIEHAAWTCVCLVELKISGPQPWSQSDYPGLDARQVHQDINRLTEQVANRVVVLEAQLDSSRSLADFKQTDIDTLRKELQAMTGLADFRQSDIDILRAEVKAMTGLAAFRQTDIDTLRADVTAMTGLVKSKQSEMDVLHHESQTMTARAESQERRLEDLTERLKHAESEINTVYQSDSWRVTKPLRWISKQLRPAPKLKE